MTLKELTDFFLTAWPLHEVLESNYPDDIGSQLGPFSASSGFCAELDAYCRELVWELFRASQPLDS